LRSSAAAPSRTYDLPLLADDAELPLEAVLPEDVEPDAVDPGDVDPEEVEPDEVVPELGLDALEPLAPLPMRAFVSMNRSLPVEVEPAVPAVPVAPLELPPIAWRQPVNVTVDALLLDGWLVLGWDEPPDGGVCGVVVCAARPTLNANATAVPHPIHVLCIAVPPMNIAAPSCNLGTNSGEQKTPTETLEKWRHHSNSTDARLRVHCIKLP
jgi:hypothetical protein